MFQTNDADEIRNILFACGKAMYRDEEVTLHTIYEGEQGSSLVRFFGFTSPDENPYLHVAPVPDGINCLMNNGCLTYWGIAFLMNGQDLWIAHEDGTISFDDSLLQMGNVYVNVFMETREYGGPEEGGWWYNALQPISSEVAVDYDHAAEIQHEYESGHYSNEGRPSLGSVLSNGRYRVVIDDKPAHMRPFGRPHYC